MRLRYAASVRMMEVEVARQPISGMEIIGMLSARKRQSRQYGTSTNIALRAEIVV